MTDKEILKQIKGYDKVDPYAVDIEAIRRGKANLALMMTLTTADHYDWLTGKFPSHNYFDYHGYRIYRRNVCQAPVPIPQEEKSKLKALDNQLQELYKKYIYAHVELNKEPLLDLIDSIQILTPILLSNLVDMSEKRIHYIGEICDSADNLVRDIDLVSIYLDTNGCADIEDALDQIHHRFGIGEGTFDSVSIDERTNWGMSSCRREGLVNEKYVFDDSTMRRIYFGDHRLILGEIVADKERKILTPHTRWSKEIRSRNGADLTLPFAKPYPLWNLPTIQLRKKHIVMLTDNLLLAAEKQQIIEQKINEETLKEFGDYDLTHYYTFENGPSYVLENRIEEEVTRRIKEKWSKEYNWEDIEDEYFILYYQGGWSKYNIFYHAARLLYVHPAENCGSPVDVHSRIMFMPEAITKVASVISTCSNVSEIYSKITNMKEIDKVVYPRELDNDRKEFNDIYHTLYDTIGELYHADSNRRENLKHKITYLQQFCWSSWFGGDEALADVNWRELRKRDVVFVLNADDEKSFATAMKVYLHVNRICKSLRFALKKEVIDADEMLRRAKGKYDLSTEKLRTIETKPSIFEDFDPKAIPEQKVDYLLEPIISDKSITMLYAPSGIGKTWFTMCIALAVSRGQALFSNMPQSWVAAKPHRVAYLDSEMTEFHFKTRLRILDPIYSSPQNAKALSFKLVAEDNINLLDEEKNHCDKITQWLNDEADRGNPIELLILDNLSTLTGFNDSAKAWDTVFAWLKTLKNKVKNRCSTIVIHHSNKKGDQRGSSAKTATVDNVIKLEREESAPDKMQFKITIEKGRDMKQIPSPFSVVLHLPTEKRATPTFKLLLPTLSQKKSTSTRTKDAIAYLTGEKKIPHEIIAALTDLSPGYIRLLSHDLKIKKEQ